MVFPWTKLKEATEVMKKYHPLDKKMTEDDNWNNFINTLDIATELSAEKKEKKIYN